MIPISSSMWWITASTAISSRCSAPPQRPALSGKAQLEHVGYGTMNGADGKPFKTRAGGVMKLYDLIAMANGGSREAAGGAGIGADYSAEERAEIARKVGIATIKFADLSNHRTTDYIFDLERFSKFEGKTGPYLQYAAVRIQSILRKAREAGLRCRAPRPSIRRKSASWCCSCSRWATRWRRRRKSARPTCCAIMPSTLAQDFSRFYGAHHILSETDEGLRGRPAGALRPGFGGSDPGSGPFGHRSSGKNVSKCGPRVARASR